MKNLKNMLAAITLTAVLMLGATSANAGILLSDFTGTSNQNPCTEQTTKNNGGVAVNDGILVAGFTGILVAGAADPTVNCGIIVGD
ncbi:hypothetical protein BH10ACI1_BH10ACI1_30950 [soil metagenome]